MHYPLENLDNNVYAFNDTVYGEKMCILLIAYEANKSEKEMRVYLTVASPEHHRHHAGHAQAHNGINADV